MTRAVEATIARSVRTLHPRFFNQNFAGADPIAVIGDFLGAALNTTLATYEAAPVFTLMERAVLGSPGRAGRLARARGPVRARRLVLQPLRPAARALARSTPRRASGHDGAPLVAFTSTHAHYSLKKAVVLLGLGRRALVEVACDERGQMRPEALAAAIDVSACARRAAVLRQRHRRHHRARRLRPVARAGRPRRAPRPVAARRRQLRRLGAVLGRPGAPHGRRRPGRLAGVEPPQDARGHPAVRRLPGPKTGALRAAFATGAEYLFQPDKPHADLDSGDLTFQCARRVDALKAWLTWKARGEAGFAARIDHAVALADHAAARIAGDPRFLLAAPPSWVNVCFWWIPPDLRPLAARTPEVDATLHALAPRIKAAMLRGGAVMLGFQPIDGGPNCFRLLFINPAARCEDIDATLDILDACGREALA